MKLISQLIVFKIFLSIKLSRLNTTFDYKRNNILFNNCLASNYSSRTFKHLEIKKYESPLKSNFQNFEPSSKFPFQNLKSNDYDCSSDNKEPTFFQKLGNLFTSVFSLFPFLVIFMKSINNYMLAFFILVLFLKIISTKIPKIADLYVFFLPYCLLINYQIYLVNCLPSFAFSFITHMHKISSLIRNIKVEPDIDPTLGNIAAMIFNFFLFNCGFILIGLILYYSGRAANIRKTKKGIAHVVFIILFTLIYYYSSDFSNLINMVLSGPFKIFSNFFGMGLSLLATFIPASEIIIYLVYSLFELFKIFLTWAFINCYFDWIISSI